MVKANKLNVQKFIQEQIQQKTWIYYLSITFLGFLALVYINYLIAVRTYGGELFFINWASARNLFFQGISPYSKEAYVILNNAAKELLLSPVASVYQFISPIYSLFIYFPFSLISNFNIARAVWMALMECFAILSGFLCLKILEWPPQKNLKRFFLSFSVLCFYMVLNVLNGSQAILINLLLVAILFLLKNNRRETAGTIAAISFINPQLIFIPMIFIFIWIVRNRMWSFIIWFLIATALLWITSFLILSDWPLQNLRQIMLNLKSAYLQLPGVSLHQWLPDLSIGIGNILAIILIAWLIFEWVSPVTDKNIFIWRISLSIALGMFIWMRNDVNGMVTLLLPFAFIFYQWINREIKAGSIFVILSITFFSIGLIILSIMNGTILLKHPYPFSFYIIPLVYIVFNLYWMRWWLFKKVSIDYEEFGINKK